jgi:chaperonin cofactor prefoldin
MFNIELLETLKNFGEILLQASPIGLLTWYFTKRHFQKIDLKKATTEVEGLSSDVIIKNLDIYQNLLDDVERRYEVKLEKRDLEIKILENRCEEFKKRIEALEKEINSK